MKKIKLPKAKTLLYPMPAVIVGSMVDGKPNFCTVAYCGIVNMNPPMISIECAASHHTTKGILNNQEFSINIPSVEMVEVTDYIGLNSGNETDKSEIFEIFSGDLENAPLIKIAPINHACKLVKTIELAGNKDVHIGEIINTYINENCLTNDAPDIEKVNPIIYATSNKSYWSIGKEIGKAWSIGNKYKK